MAETAEIAIAMMEGSLNRISLNPQKWGEKFPIEGLPTALINLVIDHTTLHQRFISLSTCKRVRETVQSSGFLSKRVESLQIEQLSLNAVSLMVALTMNTHLGDSICMGICDEGSLIQNTRRDDECNRWMDERMLTVSQQEIFLRSVLPFIRPRHTEIWDTAMQVLGDGIELRHGESLLIRFMDSKSIERPLQSAEKSVPKKLSIRPAHFWGSRACDHRCFGVGAALQNYNFISKVTSLHLSSLHYPPFFTALPSKNVFIWRSGEIPIAYIIKELIEKRQWDYRPLLIGFLDIKRDSKVEKLKNLLDRYQLPGGRDGDYGLYELPLLSRGRNSKATVIFCENHVLFTWKYEPNLIKDAIRQFYETRPLFNKE